MDGIHGLCSVGHRGLHAGGVDDQHPPLFDPKETQTFRGVELAGRQICTEQLVQQPRLALQASSEMSNIPTDNDGGQ